MQRFFPYRARQEAGFRHVPGRLAFSVLTLMLALPLSPIPSCLPGGPSCIAGHPQAHVKEQGVLDELRFLVDVHKLKRVVLIAHQGCAFYAARLELKEPRMELVQRADLVRVVVERQRVRLGEQPEMRPRYGG